MGEHDSSTAHAPAGSCRPGSRVSLLLGGEDTGGRFTLLRLLAMPGEEPPLHLHHWEDEVLYVLEGELIVYLGEAALPAAAGTSILVPRGVEHSYAIESASAAILLIYAPSGFEHYFRLLAEEEAGEAPSSLDRTISLAARHGCEFTGPPPAGTGRAPPGPAPLSR